ncbi:aldehyde dehydrogenase family protein [Simiduia sp. 21SJ11W-1]|uniref:aldehyde dehydrogenase family protein n=1 Tax=Simiduia sp. 21SJ11W-1 TaxID=2909669 RepID=UPI00209EFB68|nr:aldehyde dehydrogenase family protein [Simiduia sp. 21SJ11W-1]UTA48272.1 aldehyde dehydrogenase family protein [Simiduia sp. 21SJ11W-1]
MNIEQIFNDMSYGPAPEDNKNVVNWLAEHAKGFGLFIDGQWQKPAAGKYFNSANPATGEQLAKLAQASAKDVDAAVCAARAAQAGWQALGGHGRARYLYAIARLLQKHSRKFAVLETMDNGKPIRETRDIDVPLAIRHFYHHAGWAQLMETELPNHRPVGVVGQIIPWNFPLLMLAWKIAPALAAGNCVVLKPAEFTSLTALMFAELCEEAGLPKGVVNIVTGDGATGELIVKHPDINKLAFTGSTEVGRILRRETAGTGKKLTLELGGKSPFIVFDDADLDSAVEGLVDAIWFNQGQVCCAGSRLLVQEGVAEQVISKLRARMQTLRVGNPLDKAIDMGAIVDHSQREQIAKLVAQGVAEGATLWQPDAAVPEGGCFYPPTLLTNVDSSNTVANVEIFGPVLSVLTFRTQQEAVQLANNTRYGLAASVWSENINRALDVAPQIKAGVIWINTTNQFDAACGFGGYRESGLGREGGLEGLYEYLAPTPFTASKEKPVQKAQAKNQEHTLPAIDQTTKFYIGGKQVRPDGGASLQVVGADGSVIGWVGEGNRKDIRNAVEAANGAAGWSGASGHNRAQILYFLAENLSYRAAEFARRLQQSTGHDAARCEREVEATVERLFYYAAWADKYEGRVHQPPMRGVTLAMNEPFGVVGLACPDNAPLLSMVSLLAPLMAMGNRVVMLPSEQHPLIATDFYQLLETSDVPGGVVNIVTGERDSLVKVLAEHLQVDALWYFGSAAGNAAVELASVANLKRTWAQGGGEYDWFAQDTQGTRFLQEATQVKNIWVPYGDAIQSGGGY